MQAARKLTPYEPWQDPLNVTVPQAVRRSVKQADHRLARSTAQALCCIAIVFGAMILLLVRHSDIAEHKVNVFQMKAEVKKMELTRDELQASLNRGMDLEAIEKIALEKLGMQYPSQTQIVYIEQTALYTLKEPAAPATVTPADSVRRWVQEIPWFERKQAMVLKIE
jgi:cell division protein FtsL